MNCIVKEYILSTAARLLVYYEQFLYARTYRLEKSSADLFLSHYVNSIVILLWSYGITVVIDCVPCVYCNSTAPLFKANLFYIGVVHISLLKLIGKLVGMEIKA